MNQWIVVITGLHVLAHSIFGCCAHHVAHPSVEANCAYASDEPGNEHSHASAAQVSVESGVLESSVCCFHPLHSAHHDCPHVACHWVVTKSICADDLVQSRFELLTAIVDVASLRNAAKNTVALFFDDFPSQTSALPLRRHLAFGVLLI